MRTIIHHLLISFAAVALALAITAALKYTIGWTPFVLLYAAVGVSAWYGGLGGGLLSAGLAAAGLQFFLLDGRESLIGAPDYTPVMVLFACLSVAICYLTTFRKQLDSQRLALLERESAAREHAERLGKLKDEFLATVSHELRTPLNSILGWVQLLRSGMLADSERQQALEIIERNARAQVQLIDDLLDMGRIIAGKLRLDLQTTDLFWTIQQAVDTVTVAAAAKHIDLTVDARRGDVSVCCDTARMQQVICNLLSNSIKFTPAGGRITVRLKTAGEQAAIEVADTGRGIPPEFLSLVFERFRQAESTDHGRHSGLGLGLALVKELVERHGGSVIASSAGENCGATFTIELPLAPVSDATVAGAGIDSGRLRGR